jgi:hypothetical protein
LAAYDRGMTDAALVIDTVTLDDDVDFGALAEAALQGRVGGSLRSDCFPVDWMFRAYHEAQGTRYADRLARGVAVALTSPDPFVRAQALVFFERHPDAAGNSRIRELANGDRALFAGVDDPMSPGADLEARLLRQV